MALNLLAVLFFALFVLFLIESTYYLKKKLTEGGDNLEGEEKNPVNKVFKIGLVLATVLVFSFTVFIFLSGQKPAPQVPSIAQLPSPTTKIEYIPSPSPTPSEVAFTLPTITEIPVSPTIRTSPTPTLKPTKTPIPTRTPTPTRAPTPTKQVTTKISPSPTISLAIGAPEEKISPGPTQSTPSSEIVVQPKLPVAGFAQPIFLILLLALTTVVAGIIL